MSGRFFRIGHFWLTLVWVLLGIPTFLWWLESVPWLVFMSYYAIIVGQVSAWQAARVEEKADCADPNVETS
jgi:hypothetical protein